MTLRTKLYTYLITFHLCVLVVAIYFYEELSYLLFAVELFLVLSFLLGIKLIKSALEPFDFIQAFSDVLKQADYSARFSPVGQIEMDQLISLYNQMLSHLYSERLRLGEQRGILEKLLDASPAAVIIFDFDHRISLVNPRASDLLNKNNQQLLGKNLKSVDSKLFELAEKVTVNESKLFTRSNGERFRIQKSNFLDRGFERQFLLIEEFTKEVEQTEKSAYDKLIRVMSHEVNNTIAATNSLLNSCLNYAEQLDKSDKADFTNALNVVIQRNQSLNQFMQGYASIIRLPEPELYPVQLNQLVESIFAVYSQALNNRNIHYQIEANNKNITINADANLLEQALINIVKNAMEAIDKNGSISCMLTQASNEVIIEVIDSGTGIDDKVIDELFTPFFTTKEDGQGLGLMLIREVLRNQNFEYQLTNCENQGACFRVIIPIN